MEVSDMCKGYSCGPANVEECDDSLQCIDPQFNTNKTLLVSPSMATTIARDQTCTSTTGSMTMWTGLMRQGWPHRRTSGQCCLTFLLVQ